MATKFVGLDNYVRLFSDAQFWSSTLFTLLFALVSVLLELILGMGVALIINEKLPLRGVMRAIVLLPWAIPSVIGGRAWQLIYRFHSGLANFVLDNFLGLTVNWLETPPLAFFSLVLADVWRTTPFVAIILLAGLQVVPENLYKQAKIDGANFWQRFTKITLPAVKTVIIVAIIFRTIDALRVFDIIYIITSGGPGGSTSSLSLFAYNFFLLGDFGYGAAASIVLFLLAFGFAIIYLKLGNFEEATL